VLGQEHDRAVPGALTDHPESRSTWKTNPDAGAITLGIKLVNISSGS
jgi:hypothetical protein